MVSQNDDPPGRIHWGDLRDTDIALLKQIADEAAKSAGREMLTLMGLDPDNPREAQADMLFLRSSRQRCDGAIGKVIYGVIAVVVGSALGLLWVGFKASLKITLPLVALAALVTIALAHDSWISRQQMRDPQTKEHCCNEHDCQAESVREVPGGYATQGGDVVPYSRVIWNSADGRWWRCRYLGGERMSARRAASLGRRRGRELRSRQFCCFGMKHVAGISVHDIRRNQSIRTAGAEFDRCVGRACCIRARL
jgi:hypothetical protein